jgi:translocation and assembly module TamB
MTKRSRARTAVAASLVAAALAISVAIVLHSSAFHQYALAKIIEKAQTATGARVEIGDYAFSWRLLRIDFYKVVLHGSEPPSKRPLFAGAHLAVSAKILSIWKQEIDLKEIAFDHPVVNLQVDASGRNNLPASPANQSANTNSTSNIFDLAIKHASVNSGEIYYNDRSIPLSADVHDFHAESSFSTLAQQYKLSAGYQQGIVAYQNAKPVPHTLDLRLTASRSGITIEELTATTSKSKISVTGALSNYSDPSLYGAYEVRLDSAEAATLLAISANPAGAVQLRGKIKFQQAGNAPFIEGLLLDGSLDSQSLNIRTPSARGELTAIRAKYQLSQGNLYITDAQADTLGGRLTAQYQLKHWSANPASRLDAAAQNISVRKVAEALAAAGSTPQIAAASNANLKLQAFWTDSIQRATGTVNAIITTPDATQPSGTPLEGEINVAFRGANSTVTVSDSYLRSAATHVAMSGTLSDRSNLHVDLTASDLHEIGALIQSLQPATGTQSLNTKDLGGTAHFRGDLTGRLADPKISGQLSANNIDFNGAHYRALQAKLELSSSAAVFQNVSLQGQPQGELTGNARIGLVNWSFKSDSPINLQFTATKLSVADLQQLAGQHYPVTGTLGGSVTLTGSEDRPAGHGSLSLAQATAWSEPIKNFTAEFNGDEQSIHSNIKLQIPAGAATAIVTYAPKTKQYDADVSTTGFKLEMVNALQARSPGLSGVLTLNAKGRGSRQNPAVEATASIANLKVRDQSIPELQVQLTVANQRANATVHAKLEQTSLDAQGDVELTGEHFANLRVDTGSMPIRFFFATYAPSLANDFTGQTELHATLNGPLRDPSRMQANLEIPTISVGYKSQQLSNARPMHIRYSNNVIRIEDAEMKGAGTDIKLTGSVPTSRSAAMDVKLNGNLDLAILKGFQKDLDSSGTVSVDLAGTGTFSDPQIRGQAKIVNAAVASGEVPIGFENVNGNFTVDGNRLQVTNFSGNVGGGDVNVTGFALYGEKNDFSVNLDAKNVRVRYPDGVRAIIGGNLQLTGSPADSNLNGRMLIDRLSFTKDFDLANFMAQFSGATPAEAPSDFARNMKLHVAVQTANNLNAVSSKLSIEGAANLTVGGTAADPVILGRTTLTAGDVFFLGKRYQVQSGTIEFANPVRTQPTLNLYVTTTVQQYNITLNFVGPMDRLRTNYTSDPSLAPSDIINLIAFGKTAEESASSAGTPTSVGAESVLAQGVSGQVSGRLEKLAGISQLSIDPLAGTNPNDPGSQISIQQRVSGNLLLTFSTDVTSTQNQAVQLEYQAKRNVSVSVLRDQNGGYAIDVRVRKEF